MRLKDQGKLDEAVACYRRALELKPDYAKAHNNLGSALEEMGDLQGAEDSFRAALRHNSRFAFAHYNLAELLGGKLPEEDLAAQRRLLEDTELTDVQRLSLHFGLAKVLDARGQYAEAAEHLDRANALQGSEWRKRGQEYDPKEYEFLVTRMIAACTPDFFERIRRLRTGKRAAGVRRGAAAIRHHARRADPGQPLPGLRRGGTQTGRRHHRRARRARCRLHRGPWPVGPPDGPPAGCAALGETSRTLSPAATRIVDKMPDNYFYLGLLASLFPRAKLIHCRRDLRDVAVSCWMTHFREVRWANDQQHIASRFHEYQRMMEHWRKVLPAPLLEVDYEETVADLEGVARRLVAWCGLAWEPSCLEFHRTKRPVRTASAVQVRQPVFGTSVGRWKHYEHALDGLLAWLESGLPATVPVGEASVLAPKRAA